MAKEDERIAKQLMFNSVVAKMRRQAKPGITGKVLGLRCEDGSKCSLGHLISDADYKPEFEKLCPNAVMIEELGMPKLCFQFYDDLQQAHDYSARASDWWPAFQQRMQQVATKHSLNTSSLMRAA